MTIVWHGQACFKISSGDTRVLIDPFSSKIGLRAPRINDQIVLVTHEHYDHNAVENADPGAFLVRGPGEYEKSGVQIIGINSFHDDKQGTERGLNTIYVVKLENVTICHLGDLGQKELTSEQLDIIGNIDILLVPVGGKYTIDGKEAVAIVKQIEPKIIIPMHYKVPGLNIDISDAKMFLKEIGLQPEETESLKISAKNLPQEETKLVCLKL